MGLPPRANPVPEPSLSRRLHAALAPLALAALLALPAGCSRGEGEPSPLAPADQEFVDQLVELHRQRLLRVAHPDSAAARREQLAGRIEAAALERRVDALAMDPARAERVLRALHDSLQALRGEFFGIGTDEPTGPGPARARPAGEPADAGRD